MTNAMSYEMTYREVMIKIWEINMAAGISAWRTVLTPTPALLQHGPYLAWPYLAYVRGLVSFFPWLIPTLVPLDL